LFTLSILYTNHLNTCNHTTNTDKAVLKDDHLMVDICHEQVNGFVQQPHILMLCLMVYLFCCI